MTFQNPFGRFQTQKSLRHTKNMRRTEKSTNFSISCVKKFEAFEEFLFIENF